MSNRLDQEREAKLQPKRMETAIAAIQKLNLSIVHEDETKIVFWYKGSPVYFYPYSGWHTGKTIKDGRGLENLLNQLKP
jgi:hypothetical protein